MYLLRPLLCCISFSCQGEFLWSSRFAPDDLQLVTLPLAALLPAESEALRAYALEHLSVMLAHPVPSGPAPEEKEKRRGLFFPLLRLVRSKPAAASAPPSPSLKSLAPRPASTGDSPRLFGVPLELVHACVPLTTGAGRGPCAAQESRHAAARGCGHGHRLHHQERFACNIIHWLP